MSYWSQTPQPEQAANTNLDQDLKSSREQKYAKGEKEAREWIYEVLKVSLTDAQQYERLGYDLADILKDGLLLCQLGQRLNVSGGNPCSKARDSRMPFIQMENISFFLQAAKLIGVPEDEIFQTIDLYERADPYQVVVTMMAFSRRAHENNPLIFTRVIGPKQTKIKPPVPTKPLSLRVRRE